MIIVVKILKLVAPIVIATGVFFGLSIFCEKVFPQYEKALADALVAMPISALALIGTFVILNPGIKNDGK